MGRSPRIDTWDGWHHLTNRGARRYDVFLDDADRRLFLRLLCRAAERFGIEVGAYCLMGNHYHLLVHCPTGDLSKSVQCAMASYVRTFNERHGFDGPLFRARFHSKLITTDEYLLVASRYVHRNPLELGLDIRQYPWSSYTSYLDRRQAPAWLHPELPLELAGGSLLYAEFVETDLPADRATMSNGTKALVGSSAGVDRLPSLVSIDEAAARVSLSPATYAVGAKRGPQPNLARMIAVLLAVDSGAYAASDIAAHHGFTATASVRTVRRRARAQIDANEALRDLYRGAQAQLSIGQRRCKAS